MIPTPSSFSPRAGTEAVPPSRDAFDLSVVIVNYNVRAFLEQALASVMRAADGLAVEIFVVDNGSADGSVEMVRDRFPDVHLVANEENVGFAKANNQALRLARARHVLLLNPDTIVQEDTFRMLLGFMAAHPEAGAVGCKILNPDGTFAPESRRAFPSPSVALYRMTGLSRLFPKSRRFGHYNLTYLPEDAVAEVDALSGSCMLVRRAALHASRAEWENGGMEERKNGSEKEENSAVSNSSSPSSPLPPSPFPLPSTGAGLLDENFFMYGEDLDWCFRIQQAGWKIFYTPETQIIHYKGESTKKGELRYVRLFYGAMLRFAEKHFEQGPARHLTWLLRLGIVAHAVGLVVGRGLHRLALPLLDATLIYAAIGLMGLARAAHTDTALPPLFLVVVAPIFALATVIGIAGWRGYERGRQTRIFPVLVGALLGGVGVAAASFFIKAIAFSRLVVLLGMPLVALALSVWRLAWRVRQMGPQRAVLVGGASEAKRLEGLLDVHAQPPFALVGYLAAAQEEAGPLEASRTSALPRLGSLRRLRDVVRLRRINHVVFATSTLSNTTVLEMVRGLRDLPVRCTMWTEHSDHLIGKASIASLKTPAFVEAKEALVGLRNPAAHRAFEIALALIGVFSHPLVWLVAQVRGPGSFAGHLARRTRQMPDVLRGRRALIGHRPEAPAPPAAWGLKPGVFPIENVLAPGLAEPEAARRVYGPYVRNRSFSLDWDILLQSMRCMD
ncbi:MAG: glycosyltransferase [Rhodothermales bacterium]